MSYSVADRLTPQQPVESPPLLVRSVLLRFSLALVSMLSFTVSWAQVLPSEARDAILKSVVKVMALEITADDVEILGVGSGTIVSPEGQILTNLHVTLNRQDVPAEWFAILVTNAEAPDTEPMFAYVARLQDEESNYDLALLQITETADGQPVDPGTRFDYVPVGDSYSLLPGDPVTVVGYPGISGSTITFTSGIISGFLADDLDSGGRDWIKTDAKLASGNSGGGAFNVNGELVGVPTLQRTQSDADFSESQDFLRPVSLARPMLEAHVAGYPDSIRPGGQEDAAADSEPDGRGSVNGARDDAGVDSRVAPEVQPDEARTPRSGPSGPDRGPDNGRSDGGPRPAEPERQPTNISYRVEERLSGDEPTDPEGRYVDVHEVPVAASGVLTVSLESSEFDPAIRVLGPQSELLLAVDDTDGRGLNVFESFDAAEAGDYVVEVTSSFPREQGRYSLSISGAATSREGAATQNDPRDNRSGQVADTTVSGDLAQFDEVTEEGWYFDTWSFAMEAQSLVSLRASSSAFQPQLVVFARNGTVALSVDEVVTADGEASATFVPKTSSTYSVVITSAAPGRLGPYDLTVTGAERFRAQTGQAEEPTEILPPDPSTVPNADSVFSGSWSGIVLDSVGGRGAATVTMNQTGSTLTGTWQATFSGTVNGGLVRGEVRGDQLIVELIPASVQSCPYNLVAHRDGNELVGNYASFNCPVSVTGTMSLARR